MRHCWIPAISGIAKTLSWRYMHPARGGCLLSFLDQKRRPGDEGKTHVQLPSKLRRTAGKGGWGHARPFRAREEARSQQARLGGPFCADLYLKMYGRILLILFQGGAPKPGCFVPGASTQCKRRCHTASLLEGIRPTLNGFVMESSTTMK